MAFFSSVRGNLGATGRRRAAEIAGVSAFQIERSLRFERATSDGGTFPNATVTEWTPAESGNQRVWTFSAWVKKTLTGTWMGLFGAGATSPRTHINFNSNDTLTYRAVTYVGGSDTQVVNITTNAVFRDTSAWYHIVVQHDTTNATSSDRAKMWVNGVRMDDFGTAVFPTQFQADLAAMNGGTLSSGATPTTYRHSLGQYVASPQDGKFSGYMAEVHLVDGIALEASDFGQIDSTTGVWSPKAYNGTHGRNGVYYKFIDNSSVKGIGKNYGAYSNTIQASSTGSNTNPDQLWGHTVLLLNGNGANNGTNEIFLDSSTTGLSVTKSSSGANTVTQSSTGPWSQETGHWSVYFDGANSYLATGTSADFQFGTGDFTMEAWINIPSGVTGTSYWRGIFGVCADGASTSGIGGGVTFYMTDGASGSSRAGEVAVIIGRQGSDQRIYGGYDLRGKGWTHVAVTRSGSGSNNTKLFVNGAIAAQATITTNIDASSFGCYMGQGGNSNFYVGWLSNVKIVKGTALYTANFSPSGSPATETSGTSLLGCSNYNFTDRRSSPRTVTIGGGSPVVYPDSPFSRSSNYSAATNKGSVYLDGTGRLIIPDNEVFNFGTGNFTVECWVWPLVSGITSWPVLNQSNSGAGSDSAFFLSAVTDGASAYISDGTGWDYNATYSPGSSALANQWNHVAWVREGTSLSVFVNGVRQATTTIASGFTVGNSTRQVEVGSQNDSSYLSAYVSQLRVVKGSALYSGATYTVPTSALTATAQTVFFLEGNNGNIIDVTGKNVLSPRGGAFTSTFDKKYGTGSLYLSGTGNQYLEIPYNRYWEIGSNDYTVECWIKTTDTVGEIVSAFNINSPFRGWLFGIGFSVSGKLSFYNASASSSEVVTSTGTVNDGNWNHVAMAKRGSTVQFFVNGNLDSTHSLSITGAGSDQPILIGADNNAVKGRQLNGYIDDLRITRACRYYGNFTPPEREMNATVNDISYLQANNVNVSVTAGTDNDSFVDSPTSYNTDTGGLAGGTIRSNYAVLNYLDTTGTSQITPRDGNLRMSGATNNSHIRATMGFSSDKWYWEVTCLGSTPNFHHGVSLSTTPMNTLADGYTGIRADTWGYWPNVSGTSDGYWRNNGSVVISGLPRIQQNDVMMFAVDADSGKFWIGKNGTWMNSGNPAAGTGAVSTNLPTDGTFIIPHFMPYDTGDHVVNFGQRAWAYSAPTGFKAVCASNLATTIDRPDAHFDVLKWSADGNGTTGDRVVTGLNMTDAPDIIWSKTRDYAYHNNIFDSVRGFGQNNAVVTDQVFGAGGASGGRIKSANTSSITWEAGGAALAYWYNQTGYNYVSWLWNAGSSNVTNTDGTITTTVRANQTAGISIITYTGNGTAGATIGHGLGRTPKLVIIKSTSGAGDRSWLVFNPETTQSSGSVFSSTVINIGDKSGGVLSLNLQAAEGAYGMDGQTNTNGATYVAYCFAEIPGFSRIGSYIGNGSADGTFVYCGFKPAFVLTKNASTGGTGYDWVLIDNERSPLNLADEKLYPNLANVENTNSDSSDSGTSSGIDLVANGFKRRTSNARVNASGNKYLFIAFAEHPLKNALAE